MKIIVIDDEPDIRSSLTDVLEKSGHDVRCASGGEEGLELFRSELPDVVIADIRMPDISGLDVLRRIKTIERSEAEVVMITGHGDEDTAVTALRNGAYDYFRKPLDVREILIVLDRIGQHITLKRRVAQYSEKFDALTSSAIRAAEEEVARLRRAFLKQVGLGDIGIYSKAMRGVFDLAQKYHRIPQLPVLIEGETGTGKELVARYLHYGGKESEAAFVPVNCGEQQEALFSAELFGYEDGAFTGAQPGGRNGKFDAARGGTLFLDEIGDMPLNLQTKLLRVLQEREFYRVGGLEKIETDARIICATNRDLEKEVEQGHFREDLYHRISTGKIFVPPLRDRKDAILPLAYDFLKEAGETAGVKVQSISKAAEKVIVEYPWKGNVRQLQNTLQRAVIMFEPEVLMPEHLAFLPGRGGKPDRPVLGVDHFALPEQNFPLEEFSLDVIRRALERHQGNQSATARYLGMTRKALLSRLRKIDK